MKKNRSVIASFGKSALLPVALLAGADLHAQAVRTTNAPPRHIGPRPVVKVGIPEPKAIITPGGTFDRPQSTFQTSPGSFSRPISTFSHPASPYQPLPPLRSSQIEQPQHDGRRSHTAYPHQVIIHSPVVYEPYYIPVETAPSTDVQTQTPTAPPEEAPVVEVPPLVIDLPPGAVIRRPKTEPPAAGAPAQGQAASGAVTNTPAQTAKR